MKLPSQLAAELVAERIPQAEPRVRYPAVGQSTKVVGEGPDGFQTIIGDVARRAGSGPACSETDRFSTWVCTRDGTTKEVRHKCGDKRLCRDCTPRWAVGEAVRADMRIRRLRHHWCLRKQPRHVIVSFDPTWMVPWDPTATDINTWCTWAVQILKAVGFQGGAMVVHPWRHIRIDTVRGSITRWYHSPHVHALAWGAMETCSVENAVVKVLPERRSIVRTLSYLLDHAAIVQGGHALRWWGFAAYSRAFRRGAPPPRAATEGEFRERGLQVLCPVCGEEMENLFWVHPFDDQSPGTDAATYRSGAGTWARVKEIARKNRETARIAVPRFQVGGLD